MREAVFNKKHRTLTYFIDRNTETTINCDTIERARLIIKLCNVEQSIKIL